MANHTPQSVQLEAGRYVPCRCGGRKRIVADLCRKCRDKQHLDDRIAAARAAEDENGCWPWQHGLNTYGYGKFRDTGAHRHVYERIVGAIPPGLELDHLCRNPRCVNPKHLEPVTGPENRRRGKGGILKQTCAQGHPWVAENIYVRKTGRRECVVCMRERARRQREAAV